MCTSAVQLLWENFVGKKKWGKNVYKNCPAFVKNKCEKKMYTSAVQLFSFSLQPQRLVYSVGAAASPCRRLYNKLGLFTERRLQDSLVPAPEIRSRSRS